MEDFDHSAARRQNFQRKDPVERLTDEKFRNGGEKSVTEEIQDQAYILPGRDDRIFQDEALQNYFNSFDWYHPSIFPDDFDESMLTIMMLQTESSSRPMNQKRATDNCI